jgi:hypothetical protein
VAATLVAVVPFCRRALFCSEIVNPYELVDKPYVVTVPAAEHDIYAADFATFAQSLALPVSAGRQVLRKPDGGDDFMTLSSQACDGISYIGSENVAVANEFVVTVHYNRLWGPRAAERVRDAFIARFGHDYKIEREVSWDRRIPVVPPPRGQPDRAQ